MDRPGTLPACAIALGSVGARPTAAHIKLDVAVKDVTLLGDLAAGLFLLHFQ